MPDLIIRCPHCRHALHLPEDYLGKVVSCLECQAPFRAPVRDGDMLTEPVALARSRGVPARIFIPLAGMLMLGVAGLALNAYLLFEPGASAAFARATLENMITEDAPPEAKEWKNKPADEVEQKRRDEVMEKFRRDQQDKLDKLAANLPDDRPLRWYGLITSGLCFLGGLAFLVRRGYVLGFLGCAAAAIASPDIGCCFFGIIIGIWGLLALVSDEGRRYFRRESVR